ncbi:MAG: hypothetical protein P8X80_21940 [Desulfobacterales bacterium]
MARTADEFLTAPRSFDVAYWWLHSLEGEKSRRATAHNARVASQTFSGPFK